MDGDRISLEQSSSSQSNKSSPLTGNKSSKPNRSKSSIVQEELRKKNLMMLKRGKADTGSDHGQPVDQSRPKDDRRDSSPDLEEILASKEVVTAEDVMKLQRCCRGKFQS